MSVWGSHILSVCNHLTNLTRYHNLPPSEPGVKDLFDFVFLLIINCDRTRLQRLWALHNFIWDVGADAGDGYDWMFFSCAERQSLIAAGETTLVMVKGPAHLWSSFFMGWSEE